MNYAVRVIWETVNYSLFRFVYREHVILRCAESLCQQRFVESLYIRFSVSVVSLHTVRVGFPTSRFFISETQVSNRDYLFV